VGSVETTVVEFSDKASLEKAAEVRSLHDSIEIIGMMAGHGSQEGVSSENLEYLIVIAQRLGIPVADYI